MNNVNVVNEEGLLAEEGLNLAVKGLNLAEDILSAIDVETENVVSKVLEGKEVSEEVKDIVTAKVKEALTKKAEDKYFGYTVDKVLLEKVNKKGFSKPFNLNTGGYTGDNRILAYRIALNLSLTETDLKKVKKADKEAFTALNAVRDRLKAKKIVLSKGFSTPSFSKALLALGGVNSLASFSGFSLKGSTRFTVIAVSDTVRKILPPLLDFIPEENKIVTEVRKDGDLLANRAIETPSEVVEKK